MMLSFSLSPIRRGDSYPPYVIGGGNNTPSKLFATNSFTEATPKTHPANGLRKLGFVFGTLLGRRLSEGYAPLHL
jgi:hypothetical protein